NTPLTTAPQIDLPGSNADLENFNASRCGPGETAPLREALARSCNTAFAELTMNLGEDRLRRQAELLGIGQQDLQVPLQVAPSSIGPIEDKPALAQSGIGQRDVAITPLQDAMIAATIANGGVRMQPQMVRNILAPDLSSLDEFDPEEADTAMSGQTAQQITDMMIASEERTSGGGKISGVTIASKTGTAEHGANPKETPPHAWYVAFAPAAEPQIAVAVLVEDGGDQSLEATGGSRAAPIGRAVLGAALQGTQ
ncbi:MAG: penicillin-binding transpeptidase domain-containing protein, partial [Pseudonocardiaceae bacterium]